MEAKDESFELKMKKLSFINALAYIEFLHAEKEKKIIEELKKKAEETEARICQLDQLEKKVKLKALNAFALLLDSYKFRIEAESKIEFKKAVEEGIKSEADRLNAEISRLEAVVAEERKRLEEQQKSSKEIEGEYKNRITLLEQEIASLKNERNQKIREIEQLQKEMGDSMNTAEGLLAENSKLAVKIRELESEITSLSALKEQSVQTGLKADLAEEKLRMKDEEMRELRSKIEDIEKLRDKMQEELDKLTHELSGKDAQLQSAKKTISEQETKINSILESKMIVEQEKAVLEAQLAGKAKEVEDLSTRLRAYQNAPKKGEGDEVNLEFAIILEETTREFAAKIRERDEKIESLEKEAEAYKNMIKELTSKPVVDSEKLEENVREKIKKEYEDKIATLMEEKKKEIEQVKEANLKIIKIATAQNKARYEKEIEALKSRIAELEAALAKK